MSQTIRLKRSSTPGLIPSAIELALGELSLNTHDGKLYFKKDNGTTSIVDLTSWANISNKPTTMAGYGITDGLALTSPNLTGVPTAPTAAPGTNTDQLATTAFVLNAVGSINLTPYATTAYADTKVSKAGDIMAGTLTIKRANNDGYYTTINGDLVTMGHDTIASATALSFKSSGTGFIDSSIQASGGTAANGKGVLTITANTTRFIGAPNVSTGVPGILDGVPIYQLSVNNSWAGIGWINAGAGAKSCLIHYGGDSTNNEIRFGRYGNNGGAWETNPFNFALTTGNFTNSGLVYTAGVVAGASGLTVSGASSLTGGLTVNGNSTMNGGLVTTGNITINNATPTIYLQDTDNRSAMIHVNGDLFYVLRGAGVNSATWTPNPTTGKWPMQMNVDFGDVTFGGFGNFAQQIYVGSGNGTGNGNRTIYFGNGTQTLSVDVNDNFIFSGAASGLWCSNNINANGNIAAGGHGYGVGVGGDNRFAYVQEVTNAVSTATSFAATAAASTVAVFNWGPTTIPGSMAPVTLISTTLTNNTSIARTYNWVVPITWIINSSTIGGMLQLMLYINGTRVAVHEGYLAASSVSAESMMRVIPIALTASQSATIAATVTFVPNSGSPSATVDFTSTFGPSYITG